MITNNVIGSHSGHCITIITRESNPTSIITQDQKQNIKPKMQNKSCLYLSTQHTILPKRRLYFFTTISATQTKQLNAIPPGNKKESKMTCKGNMCPQQLRFM